MSFRHLSERQNRELGKIMTNVGQAMIVAVLLGLTLSGSQEFTPAHLAAAFSVGGLLIALGISLGR